MALIGNPCCKRLMAIDRPFGNGGRSPSLIDFLLGASEVERS